MQLTTMLYQSIQYDHKKEKRNCFEYMQDLIDKIYGAENREDTEDLVKNNSSHKKSNQKDKSGKISESTSLTEEDLI